jgi:hypothetical protein
MDNQENALALRQAILDEVLKVYHRAAADAGWKETPPDVAKAMDEIFHLVTVACEITE